MVHSSAGDRGEWDCVSSLFVRRADEEARQRQVSLAEHLAGLDQTDSIYKSNEVGVLSGEVTK